MASKTSDDKAASGDRERYNDETDRIVAALMDTSEPVTTAIPPPAPTGAVTIAPTAAPQAEPITIPNPIAIAPRPAERRTRGVMLERIVRIGMALIMGLLLWIYVLDLENPASQVNITLPVEVVGKNSNLTLQMDRDTINISVRAPNDVIGTLNQNSRNSFQPQIDLTGLGPGVHIVPVNVKTPSGVLSQQVTPATLSVQLIEQGERTMQVQIRVQGQPQLSYRVKTETQSIQPSEVKITGPLDAIQRINEVVAEVNIDGRQGTVEGDVPPRALDFSGREVLGLTYEPASLAIKVEIEQLLGYRSLPVQVPIQGVPAPGYTVTSIEVNPTTFDLYGLPSILNSFTFLETNPVDITNLTQTLQIDVSVPLTDGITLYPPGASNRVSVRVQIEQITSSTKLSVVVRQIGLAPGFQAQPIPERIDVTLSGPLDALQGLRPDSVTASVNLSGLGSGTFAVTPDIALPPRTSLIAVDPEQVQITISLIPTPTPTKTPTPTVTPVPTNTATAVATATPNANSTPTTAATAEITPTGAVSPISPIPTAQPTPQAALTPGNGISSP